MRGSASLTSNRLRLSKSVPPLCTRFARTRSAALIAASLRVAHRR